MLAKKPRNPLYDAKWQAARKEFLSQPGNQTCSCGCGKPANTVDHEPPHRNDPVKFWDRRTWKAMAFSCHSRKTARRDGGFGNPVQVVGCDASGRPLDPAHSWNRSKAGRN